MGIEQWITLPGPGKHIVLISGDEEYRSEEALPMLAQVLAKHHGFKCTVLFAIDPATGLVDPNCQTNIPGMHLLDTADMVVLFVRFRELPDADMAHFVRYVEAGKPLLGIRTSTHAFRYSRNPASPFARYSCNQPDGGFGRQVLGEKWVGHHGKHRVESTRAVPRPTGHPILQGVGNIWGPTDVYAVNPPPDVEVLVDGHVLTGMNPADPVKPNTPTMPVAWIRELKGARVFCSTMGAATDLQDRSLRRLLVNGIYWCLGMENQIDPHRSVDPVGSYNPTDYGLRKEPTGKRPAEFFQ
jgi:type 1 glutamine amidotransferase